MLPDWSRFSSSEQPGSRGRVECPPGSPRRYPIGSDATKEPGFAIKELQPRSSVPLPREDLAAASAIAAASRTQAYWRGRPAQEKVSVGGRTYTAAHMVKSFAALQELLARRLGPAELKAELEERFDIYQAVKPDGGVSGTMTAYYDPEISMGPAGAAGVPIHAKPADLVKVDPSLGFDYGRVGPDGKLIPYHSRKQINEGALQGQGLELYSTPHPVDLLDLQTEGSGWGVFPGGARKRIAFNGANGHVFRSVGKTLMDCGLIAPGTDWIAYLKSQTLAREIELVDVNPRYVFFRELSSSGGPWGATGVELVAGRSVAADPRQVPLGLPGILVSRKPVADEDGVVQGYEDFTRFVFTHDVGSAINGAVRLDVFWGAGRKAQAEARRMMFPGQLTIIVLRP